MKNEQGFTLVEVLASLVIISIVLMSFMAVFMNTNKVSVRNSEKLVVINLADSYLERVKVKPENYINFPPSLEKCKITSKSDFFYNLNKTDYKVEIKTRQNANECELSLVNVVVEVTSKTSNISSKVEGYVPDVKPPTN